MHYEQDFAEGEVLFREPPLVGELHATSRAAAPACGHCFRHIGSVELQIARRILAAAAAQLNDQEQQEGANVASGAATASAQQDGDSRGAALSASDGACEPTDADSDRAAALHGVDADLVQALQDGNEKLPHSAQVPLPEIVPCPGGCDEEAYCSAACARAAWDGYHRLLCTGPAGPRAGLVDEGGEDAADQRVRKRRKHSAETAPAHAAAQSHGCSPASRAEGQQGDDCSDEATERPSTRQTALAEFNAHADATNDIFHVAARLMAGVILRAEALLSSEAVSSPTRSSLAADEHEDGLSAATSSPSMPAAPAQHSGLAVAACKTPGPEPSACWAALRRAWRPYAVAWKAVWWEAVALPPDVADEAAFRQGQRRRSFPSLRKRATGLWLAK